MTPFVWLSAYVGFSTLLCAGGVAYALLQPAPPAKPVAELRTIRESVEQLRHAVAELSNDVAANRTALTAANQAVSDRIGRLALIIAHAEYATPDRKTDRLADTGAQAAALAPRDRSDDVTGTIQQRQRPSVAQAEVIAGWRVRRAYDGAALLEGPSGVIEVSLGQDVPNLGRLQDIKTVGGRAQVSTSRGVINSAR
jgi:outer membrane murein-binding lipoprotein Lpp